VNLSRGWSVTRNDRRTLAHYQSSRPSAPGGWVRSTATDTKLGRDVAIALPAEMAADPGRRALPARGAGARRS
jgi:hypothetical protein